MIYHTIGIQCSFQMLTEQLNVDYTVVEYGCYT